MQQINVSDATKLLPALIEAAIRGEVILITTENQETVQLIPVKNPKPPRRPGSARGMIHMTDDFDAPLEDFEEYTR